MSDTENIGGTFLRIFVSIRSENKRKFREEKVLSGSWKPKSRVSAESTSPTSFSLIPKFPVNPPTPGFLFLDSNLYNCTNY